MTIEVANGRAWPPLRRYLGFVAFALALSLAEITIIVFFSGPFYGLGDVAEHLAIVLFGSLTVWVPTGLLAIVPGLWLFRRLLGAVPDCDWPANFFVTGLSGPIFCLSALAVGWFVFVGDGPYLVTFFEFGGWVSLNVVPVAALSGWLLLRPARNPR